MAKVYIITDKDIQNLLDKLEADPRRPVYVVPANLSREQLLDKFSEEAFRFYNYHVRVWLDEIRK